MQRFLPFTYGMVDGVFNKGLKHQLQGPAWKKCFIHFVALTEMIPEPHMLDRKIMPGNIQFIFHSDITHPFIQ